MIESVTFITGNTAKVELLQRYITCRVDHRKLDIPEIQSLDLAEVVKAKAEQAFLQLKVPVLVEDTSLRFGVMGKLPGPLIKWFYEELGNEGICRLLDGYGDRSAIAEVMYGFHDGKTINYFDAMVSGQISIEPRGSNGFGWDNVFIPEGSRKTWCEMDLAEQNKTSLRVAAVEKLNQFIKTSK